jgi:hypothetical protein
VFLTFIHRNRVISLVRPNAGPVCAMPACMYPGHPLETSPMASVIEHPVEKSPDLPDLHPACPLQHDRKSWNTLWESHLIFLIYTKPDPSPVVSIIEYPLGSASASRRSSMLWSQSGSALSSLLSKPSEGLIRLYRRKWGAWCSQ